MSDQKNAIVVQGVRQMFTSHWSLIATAAIEIANRGFSAVCGHAVDVNMIDYGAVGNAIVLGLMDKFMRFARPSK